MTDKDKLPEVAEERDGLLRFAYNPLEIIQSIAALTLLLFGLYLCSPFYMDATGTAASAAFQNNTSQRIIVAATLFVVPTIPTVIGWFTKSFHTPLWRARANFMLSFGILFLTALRISSVGLNPPIWAFYMALGLVCGVNYLYWRSRK